jgi:hypothetical protein
MKFFKTNNLPRSAEDQAAYARLSAVADRTKALTVSPYEAMMASPPPASEPELYQAPTIEQQSFDMESSESELEPLEPEAPEVPETFGEPESSATSEASDEPEGSDEPEFPQ